MGLKRGKHRRRERLMARRADLRDLIARPEQPEPVAPQEPTREPAAQRKGRKKNA